MIKFGMALKLNLFFLVSAIVSPVFSDVAVLIGGENDNFVNQNLDTVETYSPFCGLFESGLPKLPKGRHSQGTAYMDGKIYSCGGYALFLEVKECFVLDLKNLERGWVEIAPMIHGRFGFSLVAAGGLLYAVGGTGPILEHDDIEVYDPDANTWTQSVKMTGFRLGFCAAATSDEESIFVFGGFDQDGFRRRVERLNLTDMTWTRVADMNENRTSLACSSYDLYGSGFVVTGGWGTATIGEVTPVSSVEIYDVDIDEWLLIESMQHRRTELALAAFEDGSMVAFGGYQGGHLDSYEEYFDDVGWDYVNDYLSEPKSKMGMVLVPEGMIAENC